MPRSTRLAAKTALGLCLATLLMAQGAPSPSPGPTNPVPPAPQAKPGADLVINPTTDECQRGWDQSMKWSKEQFDGLCAQMKAAK